MSIEADHIIGLQNLLGQLKGTLKATTTEKSAFVPAPPMGPDGQPMPPQGDPAMQGGAPPMPVGPDGMPMDPAMMQQMQMQGGQPPMDPVMMQQMQMAQGGQPPMDPSMGQPPMDPSMMPPGGAPPEPAQLPEEFIELLEEMAMEIASLKSQVERVPAMEKELLELRKLIASPAQLGG